MRLRMQLLDLSSFNFLEIIPILFVLVVLLVISKALTLPEDYYKRKVVREAMIKRAAERKDLERIEQIRALKELEIEDDNEFAV